MKITLTSAAVAYLQKPITGPGGFQSLLRRLQRQLKGTVLTLSQEDLAKLIRYSFKYGRGGFQLRTKAPIS